MPGVREAKNEVRGLVREAVAAIDVGVRPGRDARILACAERVSELRTARVVAGYHPLSDEVNILPLLSELLRRGVRLVLPRVLRDRGAMAMIEVLDLDADCVPGVYGILEPRDGLAEVPPGEIRAVLVPGVAFTALGHRLGRGGGYYDRLLRGCLGAARVACCYDEQVLCEIPLERHDESVDIVVTPTREYRCCRGAVAAE